MEGFNKSYLGEHPRGVSLSISCVENLTETETLNHNQTSEMFAIMASFNLFLNILCAGYVANMFA